MQTDELTHSLSGYSINFRTTKIYEHIYKHSLSYQNSELTQKFVLNGQYLVLVPAVLHTAHRVVTKGWGDLDPAYATMLPALLLRMIHNQIWISLSRYQTARRKNVIVDRSIEFEQVDRERSW